MLYYLGQFFQNTFGPARLLQSYTMMIVIALYLGFFLAVKFVPKFYDKLPHDRGREFTEHAAEAKGKPTGAGIVFITIFVFLFGVKNLLPILLLHNFIISSICTFSIPFVLPKILFIEYNINLFWITISSKLNVFKSNIYYKD